MDDRTSCRLFVAGFDRHATTDDLYEAMSEYGNITECLVLFDMAGRSRECGYITYESRHSAQMLLEEKQGSVLIGTDVIRIKPGYGIKWDEENRQRRQTDRPYSNARTHAEAEEVRLTGNRDGCKLYVGGLAHTVTTEMLADTFAQYGRVKSSVVMMTKTGEHRGFGFVVMECPETAKSLLHLSIRLEGKRIWLDTADGKGDGRSSDRRPFQHSEPKRAKIDDGCAISIRDLPHTVNSERLTGLCTSRFGMVVTAMMNRKEGTGYVCFEHASSASKAIADGGFRVDDRWAIVTAKDDSRNPSPDREDDQVAPDSVPSARNNPEEDLDAEETRLRKIFVGNLPRDMGSEDLRRFWEKTVGGVLDCVSIVGRGFGFVTFESESTAARVLTEFYEIGDRQLNLMYNIHADHWGTSKYGAQCKHFRPDLPIEKGKLFIGQIDYTVTDDEFRTTFERFGDLIDCILFSRRGFGYVQYDDDRLAEKVLRSDIFLRGRRALVGRCNIPDRARARK